MAPPKGRPLGRTEHSWCRAVSGGTGTTVIAFLLSKAPNPTILEEALHKIQNAHPILRSTIHSDPTSPTSFSFVTSPSPTLKISTSGVSDTSALLRRHSVHSSPSPFHVILEHDLNHATWSNAGPGGGACGPGHYCDLLSARVYALPEARWALVLQFHTAACDRTTAVGLLGELVEMTAPEGAAAKGKGGMEVEEEAAAAAAAVGSAVEDLMPKDTAGKRLWARGVDVLSYSVNSLRLSNLKFNDAKSGRSSEVVRLQMESNDTARLLAGCRMRGIKLCGALVAAGMIAAHSLKRRRTDQSKKKKYYGVVTLTDCRHALDPPLASHDFGFYHSAIMNVHPMKGGEKIWELAAKSYAAFADSKKSNKHLSDMADLHYLMRKAIDNPSLTPSSSLRTSFLTVFEDTVIDDSCGKYDGIGLLDYVGCSSVHGVGPSIAIFDTVRGGRLDCTFVYPSPLHSREQMRDLADKMKSILVEAGRNMEGILY